jgi:hypothetical protein
VCEPRLDRSTQLLFSCDLFSSSSPFYEFHAHERQAGPGLEMSFYLFIFAFFLSFREMSRHAVIPFDSILFLRSSNLASLNVLCIFSPYGTVFFFWRVQTVAHSRRKQ